MLTLKSRIKALACGDGRPATQKQKAFVREYGCTSRTNEEIKDMTFGEASRIISGITSSWASEQERTYYAFANFYSAEDWFDGENLNR